MFFDRDGNDNDKQKIALAKFSPDIRAYINSLSEENVSIFHDIFAKLIPKLEPKILSPEQSLNPYERWDYIAEETKKKIKELLQRFFNSQHLREALQQHSAFSTSLIALLAQNDGVFDIFFKMNKDHQSEMIKKLRVIYNDEKDCEGNISHCIFSNLYYLQSIHPSPLITLLPTDSYFIEYYRSPREKVINLLKLHVTLVWKDYLLHKDNINKIIFSALDTGIIPEFKFIAPVADKFQAGSKGNGDQFTIYLPTQAKLDTEAIAEFCEVLHNYCLHHSLRPGVTTKIESPITPFISLRQDFLYDEYIHAETDDESIVVKMISLQESSLIYQSLIRRFSIAVNAPR